MSAEYSIPRKHTLKILCKFKYFPRRYKRKREWVFFFLNTVYRSHVTARSIMFMLLVNFFIRLVSYFSIFSVVAFYNRLPES